jgi:hypothetical protein
MRRGITGELQYIIDFGRQYFPLSFLAVAECDTLSASFTLAGTAETYTSGNGISITGVLPAYQGADGYMFDGTNSLTIGLDLEETSSFSIGIVFKTSLTCESGDARLLQLLASYGEDTNVLQPLLSLQCAQEYYPSQDAWWYTSRVCLEDFGTPPIWDNHVLADGTSGQVAQDKWWGALVAYDHSAGRTLFLSIDDSGSTGGVGGSEEFFVLPREPQQLDYHR